MTALDGIAVLDLTRLLPGAVATQWLADFGANVIKIEQPGTGDYARRSFSGQGANPIFALTNRGKKSVDLDLKDARGKEAFLKLALKADVLIEGFRPGVMSRLGLGYEVLCAENRRLIYVALTDQAMTTLASLDEPLDDLHRKLLGHLSQAELKELVQLLEKVRAPWAKAD